METHATVNQYLASGANPNQPIHLNESPTQSTATESVAGPNLVWLIPGVGAGIMVVMIACSLKQLFAQRRKQNYRESCLYHQQIPCTNCRFSSQNFYLRCAVHPSKAMKEEAIGCSDYWAKDSNTFSSGTGIK